MMNFMSYTIIILQMLIQNTYHLLLNGLSLEKKCKLGCVTTSILFINRIEVEEKGR